MALAMLKPPPPAVGMAPYPDVKTFVGVPNWLWVTNAAAKPSATASVRGVTITATADFDGVSWDMGDGTVINCQEGTPWEPGMKLTPSPTCGHTYVQPREAVTITATMHWRVTFGGAVPGGANLTSASSVTKKVGEIQVLVGS